VGASLIATDCGLAAYCITRDEPGGDGFGNRWWCPIEESRIMEKGSGSALARCWPSTWKNGRLAEETGKVQGKRWGPRHPYGAWLQEQRRSLQAPALAGRQVDGRKLDLLQHQDGASGLTAEDLDLVIEDMAGQGKEPTTAWR